MKDEVESKFMNKISEVLSALSNGYSVNLGISSSLINKKTEKTIPSGFKTNLNKDMTFDTFVEGKSNQLAKAACLSVINEPSMSEYK